MPIALLANGYTASPHVSSNSLHLPLFSTLSPIPDLRVPPPPHASLLLLLCKSGSLRFQQRNSLSEHKQRAGSSRQQGFISRPACPLNLLSPDKKKANSFSLPSKTHKGAQELLLNAATRQLRTREAPPPASLRERRSQELHSFNWKPHFHHRGRSQLSHSQLPHSHFCLTNNQAESRRSSLSLPANAQPQQTELRPGGCSSQKLDSSKNNTTVKYFHSSKK